MISSGIFYFYFPKLLLRTACRNNVLTLKYAVYFHFLVVMKMQCFLVLGIGASCATIATFDFYLTEGDIRKEFLDFSVNSLKFNSRYSENKFCSI